MTRKPPKVYKRTIAVPIYGPSLRLTIVVADDINAVTKKLCNTTCEDGAGFTHLDWPLGYIVLRREDIDYNILAHEADHFVHKVLGDIGMEECPESDEAYAYFTGWVVDVLVLTLALWKVRIKRPSTPLPPKA